MNYSVWEVCGSGNKWRVSVFNKSVNNSNVAGVKYINPARRKKKKKIKQTRPVVGVVGAAHV